MVSPIESIVKLSSQSNPYEIFDPSSGTLSETLIPSVLFKQKIP